MPQDAPAPAVPELNFDPFSNAFFDDPYPYHAAVRESGPVVRLSAHNCWGTGRYDEVREMLSDWRSFGSSRGVGLTDYKTHPPYRGPSLVLETDPPLHDRTRRVLNRVLSASVMQSLRVRFAQEADALMDELIAAGSFDAIADLAEAYP